MAAFAYPELCRTNTNKCFVLVVKTLPMAVACVFLLILYFWKWASERSWRAKIARDLARIWLPRLLILGRCGVAGVLGWSTGIVLGSIVFF
jgi:hypothetical protein